MTREWPVWTRRVIGTLDLLMTPAKHNTYLEQVGITYPTVRKAKE